MRETRSAPCDGFFSSLTSSLVSHQDFLCRSEQTRVGEDGREGGAQPAQEGAHYRHHERQREEGGVRGAGTHRAARRAAGEGAERGALSHPQA